MADLRRNRMEVGEWDACRKQVQDAAARLRRSEARIRDADLSNARTLVEIALVHLERMAETGLDVEAESK
jgi:hypothetical protein